MNYYENLENLIGNTPLLKLSRLPGTEKANIFVKLEYFNPGFSIKDRVALNMINTAEREGRLKPGGTIVEPTSGNTGIGLAVIAAIRGYRLILTMPETMSRERMALMRHFGAELVLTPGAEGMPGAISEANRIQKEQNAFLPDQFGNPANPDAHYQTTGPEIFNALDGKIDAFTAGVGTGGTLTGIGRYLKEQNPSVQIFAMEPENSPVLSGGKPGMHGIQGIGAGFIPANCDTSILSGVIRMKDEVAVSTAQQLSLREGILCGISAGGNVAAALELAGRPEFAGKNIASVICDTGERYLSTPLFQKEK